MQIYEQEIQDGIADTIKSCASITYASEIIPTPKELIDTTLYKLNKTIANVEDTDLYYVQSILVTSSWNKNDDIFDKTEVWLSRKTPEDKPTNLEHDENTIIGHIVANWPITEDGQLIDDNTPSDQIPDKFHILTGSVIYKGFSNPELKARSEKLIAEIENGNKYVSMECYFKGFDYGLTNTQTNEYKVLARNAETAFLTKHLRAYGGLGEHEGYKIGRVLRGITFSGKGYVDKPANPDSIIFNSQQKLIIEKNDVLATAGVCTESPKVTENNIMSVEKDIEDLKTKVEAATDCAQATKDAYALAIELKDKITNLEQSVATKDVEIQTLKAAHEELLQQSEAAKKMSQDDMAKKEEDMKKAKSDLDTALETIAAYKTKEAEMMKKEKKMKRMASLLEIGLDNDTATATADKLESLEDEAFDSFAEILKATMHSKKEEKKETKAEEVVATDVLETAEVSEEADLSIGGEEDVVQNTRAALVDFMYSRLNKKNLNKGE